MNKNVRTGIIVVVLGMTAIGVGVADLEHLVEARRGKHLPSTGTGESDGDSDAPRVAAAVREAMAVVETDPRMAVLIAAAAVRVAPGMVEPAQALHAAIARTRGRPLIDQQTATDGEAIRAVALSTDGSRAMVASGEDIRVWDLAGGRVEPEHLHGHQGPITTLEASPDGHWLVSASADRTIRLWDLQSADPDIDPRVLRGHSDAVDRIDISHDGRWLASLSHADGQVQVWDLHAKDPTTPVASVKDRLT